MGVFQVELEIGDPRGERYKTIEALVDTGASYTLLPTPLLEELGITPHAERTLRLADGRKVQMGYAWTLDENQWTARHFSCRIRKRRRYPAAWGDDA